jgi:hypothetical protein
VLKSSSITIVLPRMCAEPILRIQFMFRNTQCIKIPDELYDETVPPALLATLPQNIVDRARKNITYGKAAGLQLFTFYDDRRDSVYYYFIKKVKLGEALVGFGGMWVSKIKV